MKRLLFPPLLLWAVALSGQDLTGEAIIRKANETFNVETSHSIMEMMIITSSGETRTFVYESWSKGEGEKNLIRYLEPRRVQGQATLMLNNADDIWMYFPRTGRVRKLATHAKKQNMEGSDFSYEDLGSGDAFVDDFTAERLEDESMEGYDCYTLELTRKAGAGVSYSKLKMWIIKENFLPVVIDYYDENDTNLRLKRLVQSNIQTIDGIVTPMEVVMHNLIDNTQTEMKIRSIEYDISLSDQMFTERELSK